MGLKSLASDSLTSVTSVVPSGVDQRDVFTEDRTFLLTASGFMGAKGKSSLWIKKNLRQLKDSMASSSLFGLVWFNRCLKITMDAAKRVIHGSVH